MHDDILCGMTIEQFGCVIRLAKGLNLTTPQRQLVLLLETELLRAGPNNGRDDLLTPRQREIVGYVQSGFRTKEIARKLGCSPFTVKAHLATIYPVCGVPNRAALAGLQLVKSDDRAVRARQNRRSGEFMAQMELRQI